MVNPAELEIERGENLYHLTHDPKQATPTRPKVSRENANELLRRACRLDGDSDPLLAEEEWGCTFHKMSPSAAYVVTRFGTGILSLELDPATRGLPTEVLRPLFTKISNEPVSVLFTVCPEEDEGALVILKIGRASGDPIELAVERRQLGKPPGTVVEPLLESGVTFPSGKSHRKMADYLGAVRGREVRGYLRSGWHENAFVFGKDCIVGGEHAARYVGRQSPCSRASDLDAWQNRVATNALRCELWSLSLYAAFAAPLLDLLGLPSVILHAYGRSSLGKTIGLRVAASVFGNGGLNTQGKPSFVQTWSGTANGLEAIARTHNDLVLPLDDVINSDPRQVAKVGHMIAEGVGKTRMSKAIELRDPHRWRVLGLSTGEQTLADTIQRGGDLVRAGMAVRMIDLPAGPLLGFRDKAIARALEQECGRCFGTAGPEFVRRLMDKGYTTTGRSELRERFAEIERGLTNNVAHDVTQRGARFFAAVQLAGQLVKELGILPPDTRVDAVVNKAFCLWRDGAARAYADDLLPAARRLLDMFWAKKNTQILLKNGGSVAGDLSMAGEPISAGAARGDLLGWYEVTRPAEREPGDDSEFPPDTVSTKILLLPKAFQEAVTPLAENECARRLQEVGVLEARNNSDCNRLKTKIRIGGEQTRVYRLDLERLENLVAERDTSFVGDNPEVGSAPPLGHCGQAKPRTGLMTRDGPGDSGDLPF